MEYPTLHSRPDIECSNRPLASKSTNDQNIFVGDSGRVETRTKIDRAIFTKASDCFSSFRIYCEKKAVYRGEQSLLLSVFIRPINQTSLPCAARSRVFIRRIPFPEFLASGRVECNHLARLSRRVKTAVDNKVVRLIFVRVSRLIRPSNSQSGYVRAIDLFERRIEIALFTPEVLGPIGVLSVSQAQPAYTGDQGELGNESGWQISNHSERGNRDCECTYRSTHDYNTADRSHHYHHHHHF